MKVLLGILIGFSLKLGLYEVTNYRYSKIYTEAIESTACQDHKELSPHQCAANMAELNKISRSIQLLDTNPEIWACYYPLTFEDPKPSICKILPGVSK